MKRIILIFGCVVIGACEAQPKNSDITKASTECNFSFEEQEQCSYQKQLYEVKVSVVSEDISPDEKLITKLSVNMNNRSHVLVVSPDTSMLEGDLGHISFSDINFDGVPDLAITTSFGESNLYMDYWVFNVEQQKYVAIGNYPQLIIVEREKTLEATVKNNAESYQTVKWRWNNDKLEKINQQAAD